MKRSSIPTIHLDDPNETNVAMTLREACQNVGFFYLEGHSISQSFLDEVLDASKKLFSLPLEEKQRLSDNVMSRGYTAFEEETLDPSKQTHRGDTKEGYTICHDIPASSPKYNPSELSGPNVWPTEETCTMEDCDGFRRIMNTYLERAKTVCFQLVRLLALAIGLDKYYFDDYFKDPLPTLRLLHYAREKSVPSEGLFACGAHSDYGMITLLLTDENPGLEILTSDDEWISVPPKKGSFIVNLGDMLERWTNGMFRSTMHRVLTSGESERYSIPFFYEPRFDTLVECLDVCCDESNPPKYPPITIGQHLLNKYAQTHADFAPVEKKEE